MVDARKINSELLERIANIYNWLNGQIEKSDSSCKACGKCCDFDNFDQINQTSHKKYAGGEMQ